MGDDFARREGLGRDGDSSGVLEVESRALTPSCNGQMVADGHSVGRVGQVVLPFGFGEMKLLKPCLLTQLISKINNTSCKSYREG